MTATHILRNILLFLNKLYEAVMKRKLQQHVYIEIHGPRPPRPLYFL